MQRLIHKQKRRGVSLVELVIVMGVASTLTGMGVGMIHLMMTAHRTSSDQLSNQTTVSRLSRLFHEDVHGSETVELNQEGNTQTVTLKRPDDSTITYTSDENFLQRVVSDTENKEQHRERFRLGSGIRYRWEIPKSPEIVRLTILQQVDPTERHTKATRLLVNLTAALSLDEK